jgi:ADP-ribose pyrophosphatase YjhB (NUDIX family)
VPRNETWDKAISFGGLPGAMALNVATLPITIGAGAFLVRDGDLLVVRKTYGPSKGLWTIPSGYVEPRESIVQTVEREVKEETGIAGRAGPILGVRNRVTENANDTFLIFAMTYVSGEPQPDRVEVSEAAFRPLAELTTSESSFPFTRAIIPKLAQTAGLRLDPFKPTADPTHPLAYLLYV